MQPRRARHFPEAIAQLACDHKGADVTGPDLAELVRAFEVVVETGVRDLAEDSSADRVSIFRAGGAVECRRRSLQSEVIQVEPDGVVDDLARRVDAEELDVGLGFVELVFANRGEL